MTDFEQHILIMIIDFVRRVSVRSLYDIIRDKKILVF